MINLSRYGWTASLNTGSGEGEEEKKKSMRLTLEEHLARGTVGNAGNFWRQTHWLVIWSWKSKFDCGLVFFDYCALPPDSNLIIQMHSTSLLARQERAKQLLKNACAVCFDVDSTVTVGEGIDELADYCGIGDAVAQWWGFINPFFAVGGTRYIMWHSILFEGLSRQWVVESHSERRSVLASIWWSLQGDRLKIFYVRDRRS